MSTLWNATEDQLTGNQADLEERAWAVLKRAAEVPGLEKFMPTHPKTMIELWNNYSMFWDKAIVPEFLLENHPGNPQLQYTYDTPEVYRSAANALPDRVSDNAFAALLPHKVSPMKVQYLVRNALSAQIDDTALFISELGKGKIKGWTDWKGILQRNLFTRGLTYVDGSPHRSASVSALMDLDRGYKEASRILSTAHGLTAEESAKQRKKLADLSAAHLAAMSVASVWEKAKGEMKKPSPDWDKMEGYRAAMVTTARAYIQEHKLDLSRVMPELRKAQRLNSGLGAPDPTNANAKTPYADRLKQFGQRRARAADELKSISRGVRDGNGYMTLPGGN
jgi:hypothetical protein